MKELPRRRSSRRTGVASHRHSGKAKKQTEHIASSERRRGTGAGRTKQSGWETAHKGMSHKSGERKERWRSKLGIHWVPDSKEKIRGGTKRPHELLPPDFVPGNQLSAWLKVYFWNMWLPDHNTCPFGFCSKEEQPRQIWRLKGRVWVKEPWSFLDELENHGYEKNCVEGSTADEWVRTEGEKSQTVLLPFFSCLLMRLSCPLVHEQGAN